MAQDAGQGRGWGAVGVLLVMMAPSLAPLATAAPPEDGALAVMGAELSPPLCCNAAVWTGSAAFIFGGWDGVSGNAVRIHRYDPVLDRMDLMGAQVPRPLRWHGVAWTGSAAYIFGGWDGTLHQPVDDIWRYDPASDTITRVGSLLRPTWALVPVWTGSEVLLFGGSVGQGGDPNADLGLIERFDPATNTVRGTGHVLPTPRHSPAAFWDGSHAYVLGGVWGFTALDEVVRYDPSTGSVATMGARLPRPAWASAWAADGSQVYLFAGTTSLGWPFRITRDVTRYDAAMDEAQLLGAVLPWSAEGPAAVWAHGRAYVFGGYDGSQNRREVLRFAPPTKGCALTDTFDGENAGRGADRYATFANWDVVGGTVDLWGGPGYPFNFPGRGEVVDMVGTPGAGHIVTKRAYGMSGVVQLSFDIAGSQRGGTYALVARLLPAQGGPPLYEETFLLQSHEPFRTIVRNVSLGGSTEVRVAFQAPSGGYIGPFLDEVRLCGPRAGGQALFVATPRVRAFPGEEAQFVLALRNPSPKPASGLLSLGSPWALTQDPSGPYDLAGRESLGVSGRVLVPADAPPGQAQRVRATFRVGTVTSEADVLVEPRPPMLVLPSAQATATTVTLRARVLDAESRGHLSVQEAGVSFRLHGPGIDLPASCTGAGQGCYDAARREFTATLPAAAVPAGVLLNLTATATRHGGASAQGAMPFLLPVRSPVVLGHVTDRLGNGIEGLEVRLVAHAGRYYQAAPGGPFATAITDAEGRYLLAPAGPGCARCRVQVWDGARLVADGLSFSLGGRARVVTRDVVVADAVSGLFGPALKVLEEEMDAFLQPHTPALAQRIVHQRGIEAQASGQGCRMGAVREWAGGAETAVALVSGAQGVRSALREVRRAHDILDDQAIFGLVARELKAAEDAHKVAAINVIAASVAAYQETQRQRGCPPLGAQELQRFTEELAARFRDPFLENFPRPGVPPGQAFAFLSRAEQPLPLDDLVDLVALAMATLESNPWGASSTLPAYAREQMGLTRQRFLDESGTLPSANLDRARVLQELDRRRQAFHQGLTRHPPPSVVANTFPWLDGRPLADHALVFPFAARVAAWDRGASDLGRLLNDQRFAFSWSIAHQGAATITSLYADAQCGFHPGCVGATAAAGVAYSELVSDPLTSKVLAVEDWPLLQSKLGIFDLQQDWRDEHLQMPVLYKSAVDTVLREGAAPLRYAKDLRIALGSPAPALAPSGEVDGSSLELPPAVVEAVPGQALAAGTLTARLSLTNPSHRELPDGSREAVAVEGVVESRTSYGDLSGLLGGPCGAGLVPAGGARGAFRLEADPTGSAVQVVEVPFQLLAAAHHPCRGAGSGLEANENRVTFEVRAGPEVLTGAFTLDAALLACEAPPCPAPQARPAAEDPGLLFRAALDAAAPRASATVPSPAGAGILVVRAEGPPDVELGLTLRDADGRAAGWLEADGAEGAEFPAEVRRSGPASVEVVVPLPEGHALEAEVSLLGADDDHPVPVRVYARELPARAASLGAMAPGAVYLGLGQGEAAVPLGVVEAGLREPLQAVRAELALPAGSGLLTLGPAQVDLGDLGPGEAAQAVFHVAPAPGGAPEGRHLATLRVTGMAPDGSLLQEVRGLEVVVDLTPPTVSIAAPGGLPAGGRLLLRPGADVHVQAGDALSGVAQLTHAVDGGPAFPTEGPVRLAGADGPRRLVARAVDRAGNAAEAAQDLGVDGTAPALRWATPTEGSVSVDATTAGGDADLDGFPDAAERAAGSDEANAASTPASYEVAANPGFAQGLAGWQLPGAPAWRIAPEDSPLPAPQDAGLGRDQAALAQWAAQAVRNLVQVPPLPPQPRLDPGVRAQPGSLALGGTGGPVTLAQDLEGPRARGFAGAALDVLARDGAALTVRALLAGATGPLELTARAEAPAGRWERVALPLAAFAGAPQALAEAASAPLLRVEVEAAAFPAPEAPAPPGTRVHAARGDEVRLDNVRVYVPGADRGAVLAATFGLVPQALAVGDAAAGRFTSSLVTSTWAVARNTALIAATILSGTSSSQLAGAEAAAQAADADARRRLTEAFALVTGLAPSGAPVLDFAGGVVHGAGVDSPLPAHVAEAADALVGALTARVEPHVPEGPEVPVARTVVAGRFRAVVPAPDPLVGGLAAGGVTLAFEADGLPLPAVPQPDGTMVLDVRLVPAGPRRIEAVARDALGNEARRALPAVVVPHTVNGAMATADWAVAQAGSLAPGEDELLALAARLTDPEALAAELDSLAAEVGAAARTLAGQVPADAEATQARLLVPDPQRAELRDADGDGLPRLWVGMLRVRAGAAGPTVEDAGMADTGLGDPQES